MMSGVDPAAICHAADWELNGKKMRTKHDCPTLKCFAPLSWFFVADLLQKQYSASGCLPMMDLVSRQSWIHVINGYRLCVIQRGWTYLDQQLNLARAFRKSELQHPVQPSTKRRLRRTALTGKGRLFGATPPAHVYTYVFLFLVARLKPSLHHPAVFNTFSQFLQNING